MYKLAVIQSVYKNDNPQYLKLSLDSILNQTSRDFTFFLGIDGEISSDLWSAINNVKDDRLQVIASKENKGLASILNDLLEKCRKDGYEFIARMDSDDIAVNNRFEKQLAFLCKHEDIDVVGGAINEIDSNGRDRGKITRYPCSVEGVSSFLC